MLHLEQMGFQKLIGEKSFLSPADITLKLILKRTQKPQRKQNNPPPEGKAITTATLARTKTL